MNPHFAPMDLGDIFEKTFSLIGRTIVRNLIIALIFLALPLILVAFAASGFYSTVFDMQNTVGGAGTHGGLNALVPIMGTLAFFFVASLLLGLATILADIAVRIVVYNEMQSMPISFQEAIAQTFNQKWIKGIGVSLLILTILSGTVVLAGIAVAIMMALSSVLGGLTIVVLLLVLIPGLMYVMFKWYFAFTAIAVENMDVIESMKQSWRLVAGQWWRTFGIILLFSILSQFVITIISLPITFGSMWNVYKDFFTMLGQTGGNIDPGKLRDLEQSFGPGVAIGSGVSGILTLLMAPVYTVVLYCDLRARKTPPAAEQPMPLPADTPATV